uniref:PB1-like domain-containing protein n=1 Tax=Fagus sylvatica TaxID=28930 RepID=A0A2N9HJM3_FAGSY
MTNLLFEIEIHSGGQFERNPELVYLGGKVSTYCKIDPDRLSYFEIQDMVAECGSPNTSLVYYLIPEGQSDFGGVVDVGDEGDELEGDYFSTGDELEGEELNEGDEGNVFEGDELNELVSYDWMNDGLEGVDFADDIFGGNEDEDDSEVVGNEGNTASDAQLSMQPEVGGNGGNNASDAQPSMQPEVGSNEGNNAQPGVGSNEGNNAQPEVGNNRQLEVMNNAQPKVGNNAQPAMRIDRIRVRQYAPSTTSPNQPNVQAPDWTEPGIKDYEIHTGAISDDEDPKDRAPEFNQQTDMRKPDLVLGMKFPNSRVFREALREYVVNKVVDIKFKLNEKTKISVHCKNDSMIRKTNVGSKVYIKCDYSEDGGQPKFLRMYVRYHTQKVGFLAGCRPIIGLDSCHLKGRFGGQLLAATTRDGNDNIFPVAVVVVEQEFIDFNALFVLRDLYLHLRSYSQKLNIAASTEREFERRMKYLKGLDEKAWK